MKNYIKYIGLFLIGATCFSCSNILDPEPEGQVALEELLSTEEGLITGVNGVYQPLQPIFQNTMIQLAGRSSDDGWTWRKETESDIFNIDESFGLIQTTWENHYQGITRANTVLERMSTIEEFSSGEMKALIEGQSKFMRAFYYFNLVRFYGGVPLIIEEIKTPSDAELPRSSIEEVYAQIKLDLNEAITLLPTSYSGGSGKEVGRATKYAAMALLATVNLELEEWSAAVSNTEGILGNGSLLENYADNFNGSNENGPGSIFEVQYGGETGATTTTLRNTFAPEAMQGGAATLPTDDRLNGEGGSLSSGNGIVQEYEEGDKRFDVTLADYGIDNFLFPDQPKGSLLFVNKYLNDVDQPPNQSTWNYPIIRYAEVLLMRAEALNEIGYTANGEAFDLLNEIRINAGLPVHDATTLTSQEEFRMAIRKERRVELAFETKRYFDLNRWGILEARIQFQMDIKGELTFPGNRLISHPVTGKSYFLYPIPLVEFSNNANIQEQNPGY
ncbi:RagB/SusD family nutrient uptake outer membrane protein [Kriegella aquimaris]|uniref:Starch-binding associating with outer membrane n=1 Tax=Kriegella aquimaris TaxID=192904 RepID=A0A1G9NYX1_9FLAO|nr:RagB/SusD family nutrient uptake outer membrane protein [Kriegella aquimaris]SDL91503.1 Starch-binding associating with outer membrane [Kriegella aquimaris]